MRLFIILAAAFTCAILARAVHGSEIKRLSFDVESFYSKHDPFLPDYSAYKRPLDKTTGKEKWFYHVTLRSDISITKTGLGETLWYNTIRGASTTRQFRYVGYEFRFVQQFTKGFGMFYHHHSEHGLEVENRRYPLQDSFGLSFCLGGLEC